MKKMFYNAPEMECYASTVEQGFMLSTNVEDPIVKPEQPW